MRKAVEKSLPYIERDGVGWLKARGCLSCHHVPFLLWSHNAARAKGIAVDEQKLAEWTDWSLNKSLSHRVWFKLTPPAVETLKKAGVPDVLLEKLKPLVDKGFTTEQELCDVLAKLLAADELEQHLAALVKESAQPKKGALNDGGGLDTLGQLLIGRAGGLPHARLAEFEAAAPALLAKWQEPEGKWKAAGQNPSRKWPADEADQTTTLWEVLSLDTLAKPDEQTVKSIGQAIAFLKKAPSGKTTEWLGARLLFERRYGTPESAAVFEKELLSRQNADGGWSWLPGTSSEAFSTGESLYALSGSGVPVTSSAVQNGRKFLVATQTEDGSWVVPPALVSSAPNEGRIKRLEPIYKFWGATWAVLGLVQTLPATE